MPYAILGGPVQPEPPPRADRSGRTPLYLSSLALLMALVAAIVSVVALARTGTDPGAVAASSPTATGSPTGGPTTAPPTDQPTVEPTTDPTTEPPAEPTDGPDPRGVYTTAYEKQTLRLQPSGSRYIDLDVPSANAASATGEFSYSGYIPGAKLVFDDASLAEITNPAPTAGDCVLAVQRAPIDPEVAPSKGQTLCVLTSAERAVDQGIKQKVVLLRIDAVGADGTLNVSATAWNVPK